jgi:hydrogenase/urease accessory protein HupE
MRVGVVVLAMAWMEVSESFGHKCLNAHAHEFIAGVTEQFSGTDICAANETAGVYGQDSVGRKLEEILEFQARGCGVALFRQCGCIRSLGKEKEGAESFLT